MNNIRKNFDMRRKKPDSEMDDGKIRHVPIIEVPKSRPGYKYTWIPFAAGTLAIVLLMQGLIYLSSAKNSQKAILGAATSAYGDLNDAGSSLAAQNFLGAQTKFSDALANLQSAQSTLSQYKPLELVAPQANSADHILTGASDLATAGQNLTASLNILSDLKVSSSGVETSNFADKLRQNKSSLQLALDNLHKASVEFNAATNVPDNYRDTLQKAKTQVAALTGTLTSLTNLEDIYIGFFGSGPRVYLLLFENPDEIRGTGGFIGTYGVIKIDDGKISDLKIDSIYDLDGHIYDQIAAPGPFQPYIKKWGIRDANWFADFPTSAQKILQFFESGQETADGVIAFTPNIFEDLLKVTGPINLKTYGVTLTADNFQDIVQFKTSVDYNNKQNPKQMLADLAPVLLDRLTNLDQADWLNLLQVMQDNLLAKNILLYSKDASLEQNIVNLKVAGNILPTDADYLDVVNTNLSGTKSDLKVIQKVNLASKILSDGSIIDTLTLERQNTSADKNLDFLRVLVPAGSTLVSAKGFDDGVFNSSTADGFTTDPDLASWDAGIRNGNVYVRSESGKSEFSGWVGTGSGEDKTVTLTYMIPYVAKTNVVENHTTYSLLYQKQPGSSLNFTAELNGGDLKPTWATSNAVLDGNNVNFNYTTNSDQYWATLLSK